jgi:hypothetical protein
MRAKPLRALVEHNGQRVTLAELARIVGMSDRAMRDRYAKGLRGAQLLSPVQQGKRLAAQTTRRKRAEVPPVADSAANINRLLRTWAACPALEG